MNIGDKQIINRDSAKFRTTKQRYERAKQTFEQAQREMLSLEQKMSALRQCVLVHGGPDVCPGFRMSQPAATPPPAATPFASQGPSQQPFGTKKEKPHLHEAAYQAELEQEVRTRNEDGNLPEPSDLYEWAVVYDETLGWQIVATTKAYTPPAPPPVQMITM